MEEKAPVWIHPSRFRIWGIAGSPAARGTVALVSKYSTLHPTRQGRSQLMFGWDLKRATGNKSSIDKSELQKYKTNIAEQSIIDNLSTEGIVWEWMYGPGVFQLPPGYQFSIEVPEVLRQKVSNVFAQQKCIFCEENLQKVGETGACSNGHNFG